MITKLNFTHKPRAWQETSFGKIDRCIKSERNEIMPINACVGSGKTDLACYAFGRFISENPGSKTVSVFVSPRIKLCSQQKKSISGFIDGTFGLREGTAYKVVLVNSGDEAKLTDFDRQSGTLYSGHTVFVFCDESLWGLSNGEGDPERRWRAWYGNFKAWREQGVRLDGIFYDEAHNYERDAGRIAELSDLFKLTMLASGTPAHFQKEYSREWRKNVCACSFSEAVAEGMIRKPSLNLIKGSLDFDFPAAVAAALGREKSVCENGPFSVFMLVNCTSIDQIKSILDHDWFRNRIGKDFHVVSIHSSKAYTDSDNEKKILDSRIDNRTGISSQEAYDVIEKLDSGYFDDGLPVIVFQVGMIGEGINVKCFNSVIVTTHSDRTAMQQIGRAVRNQEKDGKTKVMDGHANVYAFFENVEDLQRLIVNIQEYDVTEDCFDWGRQIDVSTGSGLEYDDECAFEGMLNEFEWNEMDELEIQEIISAADIKSTRKNNVELTNGLLDTDIDTVEKIIHVLNASGYFKEFSGKVSNLGENCGRPKTESAKHEKTEFVSMQDNAEKHEKKRIDDETVKTMINDWLMRLNRYIKAHRSEFLGSWTNTVDRVRILTKVLGNPVIAKLFSAILTDNAMKKLFRV